MDEKQNKTIFLYSPWLITIAACLGSPVAGGILLSHNYSALGKNAFAKKVLIWGILGTIVFLGISFFLHKNFPKFVLPLAYTIGIHQAVKQIHEKDYAIHVASGGAKGSAWKAVGVAIGCLCTILLIMLAIAMLLPNES
jgi:hypothetical protein